MFSQSRIIQVIFILEIVDDCEEVIPVTGDTIPAVSATSSDLFLESLDQFIDAGILHSGKWNWAK